MVSSFDIIREICGTIFSVMNFKVSSDRTVSH